MFNTVYGSASIKNVLGVGPNVISVDSKLLRLLLVGFPTGTVRLTRYIRDLSRRGCGANKIVLHDYSSIVLRTSTRVS